MTWIILGGNSLCRKVHVKVSYTSTNLKTTLSSEYLFHPYDPISKLCCFVVYKLELLLLLLLLGGGKTFMTLFTRIQLLAYYYKENSKYSNSKNSVVMYPNFLVLTGLNANRWGIIEQGKLFKAEKRLVCPKYIPSCRWNSSWRPVYSRPGTPPQCCNGWSSAAVVWIGSWRNL